MEFLQIVGPVICKTYVNLSVKMRSPRHRIRFKNTKNL